ncbi:MAG: phosphate acyltransferase PlsX [Planctomycetota bacterium]
MRIGVDVMGGDNAPDQILKGCVQALPTLLHSDRLVLFGDEAVIRDALEERGFLNDERVEIIATTEVIGMDESPVEAMKAKKNSSIVVMNQMASPKAENRLDVVISAGNTGACVAASQYFMRRLPGVVRPGICVTIPTFSGPIILIDVGANIEPKATHLAQYGVMGDVYAREIMGIKNPRVALMNVGGEEQKGTDLIRNARDLIRQFDHLNFTGFVEGRGVFNGEADVIITDGVVGNVMLKLAEGLSAGIFRAIAHEVIATDPELAMRFEPVVKSIYSKHDYHEYGGAPLLGVNGVSLISHGSSKDKTIRNAILRGKAFAEARINEKIVARLATVKMEQVEA